MLRRASIVLYWDMLESLDKRSLILWRVTILLCNLIKESCQQKKCHNAGQKRRLLLITSVSITRASFRGPPTWRGEPQSRYVSQAGTAFLCSCLTLGTNHVPQLVCTSRTPIRGGYRAWFPCMLAGLRPLESHFGTWLVPCGTTHHTNLWSTKKRTVPDQNKTIVSFGSFQLINLMR